MDGYFFDEAEYNLLIATYNYRDMVHDIFRDVVAPAFKAQGYRRKGNTFYRDCNGIAQSCNVQYSQFNHRTSAAFTYNVGLAIPSLYDDLNVPYESVLDARILDLRLGDIAAWVKGVPLLGDYWYRLEACSLQVCDEDIMGIEKPEVQQACALMCELQSRYNVKTGEGLAEAVADDLKNIIFRFFNSLPSADALLGHILNDGPENFVDETMMLNLAELYERSGQYETARLIFEKIRNGSYSTIVEEYFKEELAVCAASQRAAAHPLRAAAGAGRHAENTKVMIRQV